MLHSVKYEDGKTYQGVQHEQLFNKPDGNDRRSVYSYSVGERVWIQVPASGFSDRVHATIVKIKRPHNWRQLQHLEDCLSDKDDWHYGDGCRDDDLPDGFERDEWDANCEGND